MSSRSRSKGKRSSTSGGGSLLGPLASSSSKSVQGSSKGSGKHVSEAPTSVICIKEGWLFKKGKVNTAWQKRWVVLTGKKQEESSKRERGRERGEGKRGEGKRERERGITTDWELNRREKASFDREEVGFFFSPQRSEKVRFVWMIVFAFNMIASSGIWG